MATGDTKIEVVDDATEAAEAREFVASLGAGSGKLASRGSSLRPKVADTTPKKIAGPESDDDNDYGDEDEGDDGTVEAQESEEAPAKEAPAPKAAAIPDEKLLPDDVALRLVDQILGSAPKPADLAGASYRVNESRRRAQEAEAKAARAEETLQAFMQMVRSGKAPEPAQEPQAEELDFFENPKAAHERLFQPHVQQIEALRQEIDRLKAESLREKIYQAEAKFAETEPSYYPVTKAYREHFFAELVQRFKGDEERALQFLQRADAGIVQLAREWGEDPWVAFFDQAKRYLSGRGIALPGAPTAAPPATPAAPKQRTVRRDASIASAQAAAASPSATTLSSGGRESDSEDVTAATLIEQGPDAARRWIAQHGVRNIDMLIKPLEQAERARANR